MEKYYYDKNGQKHDLYQVVDDGFYRHHELFRKITKEQKAQLEEWHREFLRATFDDYGESGLSSLANEVARDPWEDIAYVVRNFGLYNATKNHDELKDKKEVKRFLERNGGLDFEDIQQICHGYSEQLEEE